MIEDTPTSSAQATGTTKLDQKQTKLLPGLIGVMIALCAIAVYVWMNRGTPDGYNPPPPPQKTVAEVQKQIDDMKVQKNIPEGQRQMVMGLLQGELQKAKDREAKAAAKK